MQQKQQARIESQQELKKLQQQTKKKKETKTQRQKMLEAYGKYLEGMDEDTRFYIADIAENQNPVLLIGHLYDNSVWSEESGNKDFYDTYDIYVCKDGKVINIAKEEDAGSARGLQVAKKGKDQYIHVGGSTTSNIIWVRNCELYKYLITRQAWKGDSYLYKGDKIIKKWSGVSQEEIDKIYNPFEIDYDNPIQFNKNTKENRDKYCK